MNSRKIVIIGTGMVGMSYAYTLLNQNACDELILCDLDKTRAEGEAMDLNHGLAFSGSHMKISAGTYPDCKDADIAVICAGVAQKPGEERTALLQRNAEVFRSIIEPLMESGFHGILLIATNPVDIMAQIAHKLSGLPAGRVLGSGTALDTARLRYLVGGYFSVDPRNVHAYVLGEHGETEFVAWSQAYLATKSLAEICDTSHGKFQKEPLYAIENEVRNSAQKIIQAKKATYYGIGLSLLRITRALLGDENSILTVSAALNGEYGESGVYAGVPCILNRQGIREVLVLPLNEKESAQMQHSCHTLRELSKNILI
ncbi:L-lactate dehydrogenase [Yeguia hominis]|nr:L-lactate dehydrogenase [Yeguia hominis]